MARVLERKRLWVTCFAADADMEQSCCGVPSDIDMYADAFAVAIGRSILGSSGGDLLGTVWVAGFRETGTCKGVWSIADGDRRRRLHRRLSSLNTTTRSHQTALSLAGERPRLRASVAVASEPRTCSEPRPAARLCWAWCRRDAVLMLVWMIQ